MAGNERVELWGKVRAAVAGKCISDSAADSATVAAMAVFAAHDAEVAAGQRGGVDEITRTVLLHSPTDYGKSSPLIDCLCWLGDLTVTEHAKHLAAQIAALRPSADDIDGCGAMGCARYHAACPHVPSVSGEQVGKALAETGPVGRAWHNAPSGELIPSAWVFDFLAALGIEVRDA